MFEVIKLSTYTAPEVTEVKNKGWVEYRCAIENKGDYNFPNGYFHYLMDRKKGSVTNGSAINAISRMIYGKGLSALDASRKPTDYAQLLTILRPKELNKGVCDRVEFGEIALQVTIEKKKVKSITHFPRETLLPEIANEDGVIENYRYHPDWKNIQSSETPDTIPALDLKNIKNGNFIYIIRPYEAGFYYFTPPYYAPALPYAVLEEEIGDFQINDVQNGFSGTTVVNMNNGVIADEKARKLEVAKIKGKVTGAKGDKVIVSFNANVENQTTVEKIPLDNAPEHYTYLSTEAEAKILKAHSAPAWLLGYNSGGQGLSSNADELKNQMLVFDNLVIKPFQHEIIEALNELLLINEISLKLYFKTIQPLEFTDVEGLDKETKEEETGIEQKLSTDDATAQLLIGCGEEFGDGWELQSSEDVDYETEESLDLEIHELNTPKKLKWFEKLVRSGTARPNRKSKQDQTIEDDHYKVRYSYEGSLSANSRPFCILMVGAGKLYRKEDIIRMGDQAVNAGWGPGGADEYSIWKYKGGGSCGHKWRRNTFKFTGDSPKSVGASDDISTNKARREGYNPKNEKEVSMKPRDMPNEGFLKPRG